MRTLFHPQSDCLPQCYKSESVVGLFWSGVQAVILCGSFLTNPSLTILKVPTTAQARKTVGSINVLAFKEEASIRNVTTIYKQTTPTRQLTEHRKCRWLEFIQTQDVASVALLQCNQVLWAHRGQLSTPFSSLWFRGLCWEPKIGHEYFYRG